MDRPPVQYAMTRSGGRAAFAVRGEGQAVVLPPLTVWTLHPPRAIPESSDLWQLARGARLLAFNHVGVGLSQRSGYDFSLDGLVDEMHAVIEAADFDDFVLLAGGCAGPPSIKYAVEHPERIKHLILRETWPASAQPANKRLTMFGAAIEGGDWETASQGYARLGWNLSGAEADAVAEGIRSAIDPATLLDYFRCVAEHDVSDLLGRVSVPTTVMCRAETPYPLQTQASAHADALVQAIPRAQLQLSDDPQWEWDSYASIIAAREPPMRAGPADESGRVEPGRAPAGRGNGRAPANGKRADAWPAGGVVLTTRQREVLALIAEADSNREIASSLGIAEGTVKRHVTDLLRKTGLRNRRQLMRFADELEE